MAADRGSLGDDFKRLSDSFPKPAVDLAVAHLPKGLVTDLLPQGVAGLGLSFPTAALLQGSTGTIAAAARASLAGFVGRDSGLLANAIAESASRSLGTSAFASMTAAGALGFNAGAMARVAAGASGATSMVAALRSHQTYGLPPGALAMLDAMARSPSASSFPNSERVRLDALRLAFARGTSDGPGALGRLSTSLNAASPLGSAFDDLLAGTRRRGPLGFDYGGLQRRVHEVDDLLDDPMTSEQVAEAVEEAQ